MVSSVVKLLAISALALIPLTACATGPETIDSFDIKYTIDRDGTVHVTETIQYDFAGSDGKHGIDRFLALRFQTDTEGTDRVYKVENVETSSPTGASALNSQTLGNALQIRIGNANAHVSGRQTYVIKYDVLGALNRIPRPGGGAIDEFYWNATGSYWDPTIEKTTVTVTGPAKVDSADCYAGYDGTLDSCSSATSSGDSATFTQTALLSRQGLTIRVSWPDGTFSNTDPILEPSLPAYYEPIITGSNDGPDPFWNPWNWGGGLALAIGIPLAFQLLVVARRRDRKFLGVTPGEIPADPASADIGTAPNDDPVVVQFQPPKGLPVGAAGTVYYKKRRNSDIIASLVDLAVRGYLKIAEVEEGTGRKAKDYRLIATPERAEEKAKRAFVGSPDAAPLLPHEQLLLSKLFAGGRSEVRLSELTNKFAADMRAITKALDTWIEHQSYFIDKINTVPPLISWSLTLGFIGFIVLISVEGWIFLPIGLAAGGFITSTFSSKAARRSALGHAIYLKLAGFKEYISTAEADQIRFEEADDLFSRYLPWAMVFGEAERWSKVFAQLVSEGKIEPTTDWYMGSTGFRAGLISGSSVTSIASIGSAVNTFSSMATSSFTSTPGSSGGGGGGSGGGGGGGGGGGSW
ncbi:MAG: DUF2207 domain-containing protein [Cryobacterium sp.]|nr:DUF2207 domain-containing protein [Cryobacterium sp.]